MKSCAVLSSSQDIGGDCFSAVSVSVCDGTITSEFFVFLFLFIVLFIFPTNDVGISNALSV